MILPIAFATLKPKRVLETAAGSGVVTRALASRLASDAFYTVTDLNQAMLDYAANKQGLDNRITWRQADAMDLPFDDDSFDAIVSIWRHVLSRQSRRLCRGAADTQTGWQLHL